MVGTVDMAEGINTRAKGADKSKIEVNLECFEVMEEKMVRVVKPAEIFQTSMDKECEVKAEKHKADLEMSVARYHHEHIKPSRRKEREASNEVKENRHKSVRIESGQPMGWLQYKFSVSNVLPLPEVDTSNVNVEEKIGRALIQWRYPSHVPQQSAREAGRKDKLDKQILEKSEEEFRHAFHSLFRLYKNGQCRYFYMMYENFHVLFRESSLVKGSSSQDSAKAEQVAFISSSTKVSYLASPQIIHHLLVPPQGTERQECGVHHAARFQQPKRLQRPAGPQTPFLFATLKPISLKQSQGFTTLMHIKVLTSKTVKAINRQDAVSVVTLEGPMLPSNLKDILHCLDRTLVRTQ
eukprot:169868-Hanusia_phi.AAC.6